MADGPGDANDPEATIDAHGELRTAWDLFRAGDIVPCPLDRAPLALAVDGSAGVYRFVCTRCGAASVWFESGPNGVRIPGNPVEPHSPDA